MSDIKVAICAVPDCWVETCAGKYCGKHGGSSRELREKRAAGKLARETLRRDMAQLTQEQEQAEKLAALERLQEFKDSRFQKPREERRGKRPMDRREMVQFMERKRRERGANQ